MAKPASGLYEIRSGGRVICSGHVEMLGYSKETLKDMARNGMHLSLNGKRVNL